MEDDFMHGLRATPRPEFAEALRGRLRRQAMSDPLDLPSRKGRRLALAAAGAVAVAVFALPSVRASAQVFLNLFRVVNFTAVPVNVDRINQLTQNGLDVSRLLGDQVEILADPGPPQSFATPADAANAAGVPLALPAVVPPNLVIVRIEVEGERAARVRADTRKLQDVLDALDITDVRSPAGLDGQEITLRVPPVMRLVYANGTQEVSFRVARSPEVFLPAGMDLPSLGEVGLRIAGLEPLQAHTLAHAIDWQGTLVVPVPANALSFRQVDVRGHRGLFVESTERNDIRTVVWSEGGSIFGIAGPLNGQLMLQMANSVQ
jgi:hypothetical protein